MAATDAWSDRQPHNVSSNVTGAVIFDGMLLRN